MSEICTIHFINGMKFKKQKISKHTPLISMGGIAFWGNIFWSILYHMLLLQATIQVCRQYFSFKIITLNFLNCKANTRSLQITAVRFWVWNKWLIYGWHLSPVPEVSKKIYNIIHSTVCKNTDGLEVSFSFLVVLQTRGQRGVQWHHNKIISQNITKSQCTVSYIQITNHIRSLLTLSPVGFECLVLGKGGKENEEIAITL